MSLGIIELGTVCDDQYAANLGWFAALGAWVPDTSDPMLQRLFSTAAHRHAWHAELWAARRPTIPPVDERALPAPIEITAGDDRAVTYRDGVAAMRSSIAALRSRVDPEFDPSTLRVVELVERDLTDLAGRLP